MRSIATTPTAAACSPHERSDMREDQARMSLTLIRATRPCLSLHERAIVEPPVEPVLVARHVLLHRDVDVRLEQRNARHVGEGEIDEAFDVRLVLGGVA